ncbi:ribonuclease H-like protein [Cadophora sp. DSE1049]|nr:ribonuclease H-like protein [Cadophora sp. DSE1049]
MPPWEPDKPIELGNGLLICGAHRQMVCTRCCVDYSFLLEESDDEVERTGFARVVEEDEWDEEGEEEEEDDEADAMLQIATRNTSMTRAQLRYRDDGTLIVPDIHTFVPPTPTTTPSQLFPLQHRPDRQYPRFAHQSSPGDLLIYTDGACLNNGQPDPAAGWGFVFRAPEADRPEVGRVSGRLEDHGPSDEPHPQTSNRAELRAVIAAIQFRAWFGEGWTRLVIATDSEYVTRGATEWVRAWGRNGWVTSNRTAVKNRDLWEELLGEVIGYRERGMDVCFWRIPRAWNEEADRVAKAGAREERCLDFNATIGVLA